MKISRIFVTLFGVGFLPKAPGTWGTLFSVPIIWALMGMGFPYIIFPLGCLVSWGLVADYLVTFNKSDQDPKEVVIDEFLGLWTTLIFFPRQIEFFIVGFILFRIFDIWKPWPIKWADELKGNSIVTALGILLDDIFAGLISAGIIGSLTYFFGLT